MASVYDVDTNELIEKAAVELKSLAEIKPPSWAGFVKTGVHKQRHPERDDWWHVRTAAVLRSVYLLGPIGVSKLRTKYGGKKDRGHKPERVYKGSGSIIRKILQQLEKVEFVKQTQVGVHKGRVLTPKGKSFLDKLASGIRGPQVKKIPKVVKSEKLKIKKPKKIEPESKKVQPKKKESKAKLTKLDTKPAKKSAEK